jgi:FtsH-binding integral membrane protein
VLTAVVYLTRFDFSFMAPFLAIAGIAALGLIVASIVFGFHLGMLFTVAMIVFACGYILYDTSNVLHHYRIGQHVAAALALFSSVILLFWYVVRLFLISRAGGVNSCRAGRRGRICRGHVCVHFELVA